MYGDLSFWLSFAPLCSSLVESQKYKVAKPDPSPIFYIKLQAYPFGHVKMIAAYTYDQQMSLTEKPECLRILPTTKILNHP